MMFKSTSAQGELNGFLDAGSQMEGELRFEDTFRVDGKFKGTIVSQGDLIVGEAGEIDAEVRVRRVFVSGIARGTIRTSVRTEITSKGRVMADLFTPSLSIEDGAFFEGRCSMEREKAASEEVGQMAKVAQLPIAKRR
ncbi:MAG: polymer-forming cytoskeletal protein [Thermoanaerobaculia bacterium]|nr:polymer-forming cytoskeletal protein [Thermoanaerobaculia bacterium]